MLLRKADQQGLLLWAIIAIVLSIGFVWFVDFPFWLCVFIALTMATFLVMLVDKVQARTGDRRISERSLYIMTFFGGSLGMLAAIYVLRHKRRKLSFQIVVWALLLVQVTIVYQFIETPLLSITTQIR